jgi:ElaB/YqjD/DUF883 family membrane-anchored ribosome-binding protein
MNPRLIKEANMWLGEEYLTEEQINEGIKEIFNSIKDKLKDTFNTVKSNAKKLMDRIKDSSEMLAIKALNSISAIKDYINNHPKLVWLVIGAIIAGVLIFPATAHAAVASPNELKDLAGSLPNVVDLTGTANQLHLSVNTNSPEFHDFLLKFGKITLEGNNLSPGGLMDDMYKNVGNEFLSKNDAFKQLMSLQDHAKAEEIYKDIFTHLANAIARKLI